MCDERPISESGKGDDVVEITVEVSKGIRKKRQAHNRKRISKNAIEKLTDRKEVIKCKDGVVQMDKNHPDYNFWMED